MPPGYERFALTGITTGIAAEEAKKINASLLALGAVVNGLADKQKHVPYRNSKLTRLLRDCLGGTSKSTIVLTIGPCDKYKQETAGMPTGQPDILRCTRNGQTGPTLNEVSGTTVAHDLSAPVSLVCRHAVHFGAQVRCISGFVPWQ